MPVTGETPTLAAARICRRVATQNRRAAESLARLVDEIPDRDHWRRVQYALAAIREAQDNASMTAIELAPQVSVLGEE